MCTEEQQDDLRSWSRGSEGECGGTQGGDVVGSHVVWGLAGLGRGFPLYQALGGGESER